jgi:hypothetical protein
MHGVIPPLSYMPSWHTQGSSWASTLIDHTSILNIIHQIRRVSFFKLQIGIRHAKKTVCRKKKEVAYL